MVIEEISEALGDGLEVKVAGVIIVAIELGKPIVIIEAQETTGRRHFVMTVAVIAIDGSEMNPSEAVDHRHHLPEVAHQVTAVANPLEMPQQARM